MTFGIKMAKRDGRGNMTDIYLEQEFETAGELADFYNRNAASPKNKEYKKEDKEYKITVDNKGGVSVAPVE